jgi:23S rRNA (uracil1939-C5)-methyltransferase
MAIANSYSERCVTEQLKIARLGHRGDGVADTNTGPVYVSYTLPGETVTAEPVAGHPDRRQLLQVEHASAERVAPISPFFGTCGGCALQHWALAPQQEWKRRLVIDALHQAGIEADVAPTLDAHGEGRRRITLHARRRGNVLEVGFTAARSHDIVPIDHCPILAPSMAGAIPAAWAIAQALNTIKPLDIQITATDTGLDIDLRGSGPLKQKETAALAAVADKHGLARITRHGELVAQRVQPTLKIGRASVPLPPGAFLQATTAGEETLARLVLDYAGNAKTIADLFCGVGPFALRLAEKARITAADNDAAAIAALKRAATTQGLKPLEPYARDLFRSPLAAPELKNFGAVVFDPPRQGAQAQARELAMSKVPVVIAVSCSIETFARDARILIDGGYRIESVTPVDQFRYSAHVEMVARFVR